MDQPQDSAASGGAASDKTLPEGPSAVPSAGSSVSSGSQSRALRDSAGAIQALPAVTTASFDSDVTRLLRAGDATTPAERAAEAPLTRACPGPTVHDGAVANPVRLDGVLSVLLVHPAKDGTQRVEAWTCAGDRRLQSTRLTGAAVTP